MGRELLREYETRPVQVDLAAAEEMLEARLAEALARQVGEGSVQETSYTAVVREGCLVVTLKAACREEIGVFVPKT